VAGVPGRTAYAQDEETPAQLPNPRQTQGHPFDGGEVHVQQDLDRFRDEYR
jgi:hypothetical protein